MSKNKFDKIVNELYKKHFDRVQVNIMKLPAIYKEIETIAKADDSEENKAAQLELLVEKFKVG
jgi:hypothetical protein